jgi:hypothetical protein
MEQPDRLEELKMSIRERLRHVCPDMSDESFQDLVQKIAANELKAFSRLRECGPGERIAPT